MECTVPFHKIGLAWDCVLVVGTRSLVAAEAGSVVDAL